MGIHCIGTQIKDKVLRSTTVMSLVQEMQNYIKESLDLLSAYPWTALSFVFFIRCLCCQIWMKYFYQAWLNKTLRAIQCNTLKNGNKHLTIIIFLLWGEKLKVTWSLCASLTLQSILRFAYVVPEDLSSLVD